MMHLTKYCFLLNFILLPFILNAQDQPEKYTDKYRPQIHFSPAQHWVNDPNGMVYFNNTYHLFFQYYPQGTTWGPMHWGHATSTDLFHWKEQPIALYPDSLGYIFSGSAVVDSNNTSGFGKNGAIPLVAIFTNHDMKASIEGKNDFQNQSLAYSLDNGLTWTKYSRNPVLKSPGIRDFRDPKVMWYAPAKKWIMTLAANDRIIFYSSLNLKDWKEESTFGLGVGSHIGVWECPDLFPLQLEGKTYWVLVVNVNSGGPNKGSATQYFLGGFDGNKFSNMDAATRWLDYGPDEYAGITWSNTGDRKIFLGWMSNWQYANQVPTEKWRNAMTIPRKLSLQRSMEGISIVSKPVAEISNIGLKKTAKISATLPEQWQLKMDISTLDDYCITLSNKSGNQVLIGYDAKAKQYYIDRTKSGKTDFEKNFSGRFTAPRLSAKTSSNLTLVVDASSVELFADDGLSVMTAIYFPDGLLDKFSIKKAANLKFTSRFIPLKSIW